VFVSTTVPAIAITTAAATFRVMRALHITLPSFPKHADSRSISTPSLANPCPCPVSLYRSHSQSTRSPTLQHPLIAIECRNVRALVHLSVVIAWWCHRACKREGVRK
jgi:hypothetical protein